ncbi:MAG: hypothetical protein IH872_10070 [Chloroflexi bacterium]|nr:hypothetical protein [Chloroflexota bacterium]
MPTGNVKPTGSHLMGSMPLETVDDVFITADSISGRRLKRVPDGELGSRTNWVAWQYPLLAQMPGFDEVAREEEAYVPRPILKVQQGITAADLSLGPLGYADAAVGSYQRFKALKENGGLSQHLRFQVGLPAPLEPVIGMFTAESREIIAPLYEERMLEELEAILAQIPHDQLAIQWEVCYQLGVLEGIWEIFFPDPDTEIPARLAKLAGLIPTGVEAGFHLCYGDSGHRHFKQPDDTGIMVRVANGIFAAVPRKIDWVHMPVPRDRSDEAYFKPLGDLELPGETDLFLGLVHNTDGEEGARRRIAAAGRVIDGFGVAAECGLGRRPPETIPGLLRVHASVSDPF